MMIIKKAELNLLKAKKREHKKDTKFSEEFEQKNESETRLKVKVVRDFSIPQIEYQQILDIKELCRKAGIRAKRREILRAGLKVLSQMSNKQILVAIAGLTNITTAPKLDS